MNHFGSVGSDTGSRGSSPMDFAGKTGFFLTFLHVELANMPCSQNFDDLFFCMFEGRIQPPFSGIFWDKLGQICDRQGLGRRYG
jgi:hypothetical protein